jgi:tripeptidyl-peptidase-1
VTKIDHSVTAVGATIHIPETAVFFSGGGFSNYVSNPRPLHTYQLRYFHQFTRPSYQDAAVSEYLVRLAPSTYEGLYNS